MTSAKAALWAAPKRSTRQLVRVVKAAGGGQREFPATRGPGRVGGGKLRSSGNIRLAQKRILETRGTAVIVGIVAVARPLLARTY